MMTRLLVFEFFIRKQFENPNVAKTLTLRYVMRADCKQGQRLLNILQTNILIAV